MNELINILELNRELDSFLYSLRQIDKKLMFTYRKSNYGGRLDEGYWFYGTENYLAVSFWSGMDWKNRTPNIIIRITNLGDIFLEINVSDSDRKREFVDKYLVNQIGLIIEGRRYIKQLNTGCDIYDAIHTIEHFLMFTRRDIDNIILSFGNDFFLENENSIGFIDKVDFNDNLKRINLYKNKLRIYEDEEDDEFSQNQIKPYKIKSFSIRNYGVFKKIEIKNIPENNQWIFITGENGSGKTNLLRAIATTFGYKKVNENYRQFRVESELYVDFQDHTEYFERNYNEGITGRKPKLIGLCMYGPYRLINSKNLTLSKFKDLYNKDGSFNSLFSDAAPLLDLEKQFVVWRENQKSREFFEKRKYYLQSILTDIVPGLFDIRFEILGSDNKKNTRYITRKNYDDVENGVLWEELPSGTKSVFSLIVDIMFRLYKQQPKIIDPSELKGVVLIDEIDLHLHPKAQREIIINLTKVFKQVQFIVTTHSPIPLLGAPRNSQIYVMQNNNGEINIERMDDKVMFSKILPNALFSSPIFGLEELTPVSKLDNEIPYLDDDYKRVKFLEQLDNEVDDFLTNAKQKELLSLFLKK
ncbi:AAA family ATPase [Flavobacterium sp.]|jgi:predicted ATP-binding protein involved in virulence|uniref:AAA family ATPase n=1 Tax=Flavobacterium sp. TaxID=239 RepID=UPI0022C1D59A|nr:AAA family ATPase [Flavobacterium sp.]MCZ8091097.1 AAA family ATPase [Flavobacterium sp.]